MGKYESILEGVEKSAFPEFVQGYGDNPEARIVCVRGKRMCKGICGDCGNNIKKYKDDWILQRAANLHLQGGGIANAVHIDPHVDPSEMEGKYSVAIEKAKRDYTEISEEIKRKKIKLYEAYKNISNEQQRSEEQILETRKNFYDKLEWGNNFEANQTRQ